MHTKALKHDQVIILSCTLSILFDEKDWSEGGRSCPDKINYNGRSRGMGSPVICNQISNLHQCTGKCIKLMLFENTMFQSVLRSVSIVKCSIVMDSDRYNTRHPTSQYCDVLLAHCTTTTWQLLPSPLLSQPCIVFGLAMRSFSWSTHRACQNPATWPMILPYHTFALYCRQVHTNTLSQCT